jgi:hypothetical protein
MNLKQALFSLSYTDTIGLSDLAFDTDPTTPSTVAGHLNPNLPAPDCFEWPAHVKGPLVGPEGVSHEAVKQAINNGALVGRLLQILGPDYVVTDEDLEVVMYVKSKMGGPTPTLWNNDILPLGKAATPVTPTTPPVHPPKPPVPPKPDPGTPEFRLESLVSDLKRILAAMKAVHLPSGEHGGPPAVGLRKAIHDLELAIGNAGSVPS